MSDSTQSLRRTIRSGKQLQGVVRTMKALAASNIGQYEQCARALADYDRTVKLGLGACLRDRDPLAGTMQRKASTQAGQIRAIVFGSDQGLVGQFNDVVAEFAIKTLTRLPGVVRIWTVGERVHARLTDAALPLVGPFTVPTTVRAIGSLVDQLQLDTEAHRINDEDPSLWVFYNRPLSATLYEPVSQRLLPLDAAWQQGIAKVPWSGRNLPQILGENAVIMHSLVREYLFISLFRACAESLASENTSRLAAMQRADQNIDELLQRLNGSYNQLRQSGIDQELFDVISGFEALSMRRPQQPVPGALTP